MVSACLFCRCGKPVLPTYKYIQSPKVIYNLSSEYHIIQIHPTIISMHALMHLYITNINDPTTETGSTVMNI